MRRMIVGSLTLLLGLGLLGPAGCSESDEGELEKAGKEADAALEEAGKEVEDAGKEIGKAIDDLGN